MKKTLYNLFYIVIFLFSSLSCQKQKSPSNESNSIKDRQAFDSTACAQVSFIENVLEHTNVLNLFKCVGWEKDFKTIYTSIKEVSSESWNHLFLPIDAIFMKDKQRRNKLFDAIKKLDQDGALDDLSNVITVFNDTNFFDSLSLMLQCTDDPSIKKCEQRGDNLVKKEEMKKILSNFDVSSDTYAHLSKIIKSFSVALTPQKNEIQKSFSKIVRDSDFISLRMIVFDEITKMFINNEISEIDKLFFNRLLLTNNPYTNNPWLFDWIRTPDFDKTKFSKSLGYIFIEHPEMFEDLSAVANINQRIPCRQYQNSDGIIEIDIYSSVDRILKSILDNKSTKIAKSIQSEADLLNVAKDFCPFLIDNKQKIKQANPLGIKDVEHSLNFPVFLSKSVEVLKHKENLELIKYLLYLTAVSTDIGSGPDLRYILSFFKKNAVLSSSELLITALKTDPLLFERIYNVLIGIDLKAHLSTAALVNKMFENTDAFRLLSKFWWFYEASEKSTILKFVDAHFNEDTELLSLLKFYTFILDELVEAGPEVAEKVLKSDVDLDKTFTSLRDLAQQLEGKNVLSELKVFFSSSHILRIVKILSKGVELKEIKKSELELSYVNQYIQLAQSKDEKLLPNVNENDNDLAKRHFECVQELSKGIISLSDTVLKFPDVCIGLNHFSTWVFQSLSEINVDYALSLAQEITTYNKKEVLSEIFNSKMYLLDDKGLMSPRMINYQLGLLISLNEIIKKTNNVENGIDFLLNTLKYYLFEISTLNNEKLENGRGFIYFISKTIKWVNSVFQFKFKEIQNWRNAILKNFLELTDDDKQISDDLLNSSILAIKNYGYWLNSGKANETIHEYLEAHSCKSAINANLGVNPCPDKTTIKKSKNYILKRSIKEFGGKRKSALHLLIEAVMPSYGIKIPYESNRPARYNITLKELLKSVYDMTDKNYIGFNDGKKVYINQMPIKYNDKRQIANSLERVEVAIRDVRFDDNFFGARYANSVARALDYDEMVIKNRTMMKACVPLRFCGKTLNSEDKRLAKNAISSYDGLLHSGTVFGHRSFMKALLAIVVGSSSLNSQKDSLIKFTIRGEVFEIPKILSKEDLVNHNGQLLIEFSKLSALTNLGRLVRDRVGRNRVDFEKFINSYEFLLINESFINFKSLEATQDVFIELVKKVLSIQDSKGDLIDHAIDWIEKLNYHDLRIVESTLYDLMVINSFLGAPKDIPSEAFKSTNKNDKDFFNERYMGNNVFRLLARSHDLVRVFFLIERNFPKNLTLLKLIKRFSPLIKYLKEKLVSENIKGRDSYYFLLNEYFLQFNKLLFNKFGDEKGIDLILSIAENNNLLSNALEIVDEGSANLSRLHYGNTGNIQSEIIDGNRFIKLGENLEAIMNSEKMKFDFLKDYLKFTTIEKLCTTKDPLDCNANYHFDEPAKILNYLSLPATDSNQASKTKTKIEAFFDDLFRARIDDFEEFLLNVIGSVKLSN